MTQATIILQLKSLRGILRESGSLSAVISCSDLFICVNRVRHLVDSKRTGITQFKD